MDNKNAEKFRALFENDLPTFYDRVDSPWENIPDLMAFNESVYKRIRLAVNRIANDNIHKSRGFLVLGEAGTGKTHLLMRIARELSKKNSPIQSKILFIRRPNNEVALAQHIWDNIVSSLDERSESSEYSQLDELLAHIFSKVLCTIFSAKNATDDQKVWKKRLEENPYHIFKMLGNGEQREKNKRLLSNYADNFIKQNEPSAFLKVTKALIKYCLYARDSHKNVLLNWLRGNNLTEEEAKPLGLPTSWIVEENENINQESVDQQKEEFALKAIQTIGVLSKYYQPLIIAFDQLEGLRGKPSLTNKWGDIVREIFTRTPNVLVVTCIFPSLWNDWFQNNLDQSARERIAQEKVTLDDFSIKYALPLFEEHWNHIYRKYQLPTRIYPFTEDDINNICQKNLSPREFLQEIDRRFNDWVIGNGETIPETIVTRETIEKELESTINKCQKRILQDIRKYILSEENLYGQIDTIIDKFLQYSKNYEYAGHAILDKKVMPSNIIINSLLDRKNYCIGILNKSGIAFTSRIKNISTAYLSNDQFDSVAIIRSEDSGNLGPRARIYVNNFENHKGQFVFVTKEEIAFFSAIYEILVQIEEHDLVIREHEITNNEFFDYLVQRKEIKTNPFVKAVFSFLNGESKNEKLDQQILEKDNIFLPETTIQTNTNTSQQLEVENNEKNEETEKNLNEDLIVLGNRDATLSQGGILGKLVRNNRKIAYSFSKPMCCGVYGYMGSGKSYALGVLIENALLNVDNLITNEAPTSVIAFNYRRNSNVSFEYASFAKPNNHIDDVIKLLDYGGVPQRVEKINILGYEHELNERRDEFRGIRTYPIKFLPSELSADHWNILLKPPTANSEYMSIVRSIIRDLSYRHELTLDNLELEIQNIAQDRLSINQLRSIENRLMFAKNWVTDHRSYDWSDIFTPGTLTVFDLRMATTPKSDILSLCLILSDIVRSTKNGVNKTIVFDEAHEYIDSDDSSSKDLISALENMIRQMRHDGISFILSSQFPKSIPQAILKHLLTRIIFKIPDSSEIKFLQKSAPELEHLSPIEISNLDLEQGICFVQTSDDCSDKIFRTPQKVEIRPRCSLHGGNTKRSL